MDKESRSRQEERYIDFRRLFSVLKRGILWILAAAVLAGAFGYVYSKQSDAPVYRTTGAGDAKMAALCCCLLGGDDPEQTARCALAVAAASVMQPGTKAPRPDTVQQLLDQIVLETMV